jgi:hypothetical protein
MLEPSWIDELSIGPAPKAQRGFATLASLSGGG